jgi:hypothetical protein
MPLGPSPHSGDQVAFLSRSWKDFPILSQAAGINGTGVPIGLRLRRPALGLPDRFCLTEKRFPVF